MRTSIVLVFATLSMAFGSGCALGGDASERTEGTNADALTQKAAQRPAALVDSYENPAAGVRELVALELRAGGTYGATVNITDIALCRTFPCTGPEAGTWSATPVAGECATYRLQLSADTGETRSYLARVVPTTGALELADATGVQTLTVAAPSAR